MSTSNGLEIHTKTQDKGDAVCEEGVDSLWKSKWCLNSSFADLSFARSHTRKIANKSLASCFQLNQFSLNANSICKRTQTTHTLADCTLIPITHTSTPRRFNCNSVSLPNLYRYLQWISNECECVDNTFRCEFSVRAALTPSDAGNQRRTQREETKSCELSILSTPSRFTSCRIENKLES